MPPRVKYANHSCAAPDGHSCGDGHSHGGCANGEDAMMNLEAAPVQMEQKTRRAAFIPKDFQKKVGLNLSSKFFLKAIF